MLALVFISTAGKPARNGESGEKSILRYTRLVGTREAEDFQILVDRFMEIHPETEVVTEFLPRGVNRKKFRPSLISGDAVDVVSLSQFQSVPCLSRGAFENSLSKYGEGYNVTRPGR